MTISDINSYVTFRTGADTTSYSAANRLISTNRWYHKIASMIIDSDTSIQWDDDNQTGEAIITKNLTADQKYVQLATTDEILKVQRVELTYDGSNWYKAAPIEQGQISNTINLAADINNIFSTAKPYYEIKGLYLYLYPVPTASVTNGIKLWVQREADEFTSAQVTTGTKEPGFAEPWHVMVALGMIYDWCSAKGNNSPHLAGLKNDVEKELADYEYRLKKFYGTRSEDVHMQFAPAFTQYK